MRFRVLFAYMLVFILLGCQAAPPATPSPTALSGETPSPAPSVTPAAAQTAVPSATVSPTELIRRASPICENAFSAAVETEPLTPPFALLKKETYADHPAWELSYQLPHMSSPDAHEVRVLFCVSETRAQTGTFTDGSAAYQHFWEVRAVSWPGGKVIGRKSFTGSPPPKTKVFSSEEEEGLSTHKEFAAWIFSRVDHPDFLYFKDAITSLAISPDGRRAAFGSAVASQVVDKDYQAQIYLFNPSDLQTDLGTSSFLDVLEGHQGMVTSLAFSPDGKTLASSGYDLFVKFWDVASGRLLGQVSMADTPNFLAFSPDGSRLAVASNLQVSLMNPVSMQLEQSIPETGIAALAFSPGGRDLYVHSSKRIKIIDTTANRVTLEFPDPVTLVPTIAVAEDGSLLGVTYEIPDAIDDFALSPDGTQIISLTVDRSIDSNAGAHNVRLGTWNANTGKYLSETKFVSDFPGAMKLSADGSLLAIANNHTIQVWDTASWQVRKELTGHNDLIDDLEFSADGTRLISASRDGTIRVWSLEI